MRIAIDAMGGDHAPQAIVDGALKAVAENPELELVLVGIQDQVEAALGGNTPPQVSICHAPEVIRSDDHPLLSIRSKKNSSMIVAFDMLKNRQVSAVVSAGNTGALMAGALFHVGLIPGILRPALAPIMPCASGEYMLIDGGANAECKPQNLLQFGMMGSIYMEMVLKKANPRVALLNIGSEENKGGAILTETYRMLKESKLNFIGNMESRDVMTASMDVLVTDGFSGNVMLKSIEGTALFIMGILKEEFTRSPITKLGAFCMKGGLNTLKGKMDYSHYGGAVLMGIDGCVVKAHGSSKPASLSIAIHQAADMVRGDVVGIITSRIPEMKGE